MKWKKADLYFSHHPTTQGQNHGPWPGARSAQSRRTQGTRPQNIASGSPKVGCLESPAGGAGEQAQTPRSRTEKRCQVSPRTGCGILAMGSKQQLREVPALTITGPGYRDIEKARAVPSVGSCHRPAGGGSVNTSEGEVPNALARCSLGREFPRLQE